MSKAEESAGADILVVDDEVMNRRVLKELIEALGHRTRSAEDGQVALDQIRAQPPDLILLDIMMPGMDGHEVLDRLKAHPTLCDIPVLVISALGDMDNIVRCIEAGAASSRTRSIYRPLVKSFRVIPYRLSLR